MDTDMHLIKFEMINYIKMFVKTLLELDIIRVFVGEYYR